LFGIEERECVCFGGVCEVIFKMKRHVRAMTEIIGQCPSFMDEEVEWKTLLLLL
jgi:hypothetical protein